MNRAPILLLQMQRMGDLVLSFPLLAKLGEAYPDSPLWVIGEERFFKPLLPLSPRATYFSYANAPDMRAHSFTAVINLSFRPEAAALAGQSKTEARIGPWSDTEGRLFINGNWQLYRASLTHNNRYNRYHWADLNCLDALPPDLALCGERRLPRPLFLPDAGQSRRIGLFLGASEREKHPDPPFWAALAKLLLKKGYKPVLLGGEAENALAQATAEQLGAPHLNLAGRFSIAALARFIEELDLLITPDTGPMHIASGLGTPVLNLSMGPVNPWETGPSAPGHHILRPTLNCAGCWRCTKQQALCRDAFSHAKIASVIDALFAPENPALRSSMQRRTHGLELLRSARDGYGLYRLDAALAPKNNQAPQAREALSRFWQAWFGALFGLLPVTERTLAWKALQSLHPERAEELTAAAATLALKLARNFRSNPQAVLSSPQFWQEAKPLLHPLSGYIQMYVQNERGSRKAFAHALSLAEEAAGL